MKTHSRLATVLLAIATLGWSAVAWAENRPTTYSCRDTALIYVKTRFGVSVSVSQRPIFNSKAANPVVGYRIKSAEGKLTNQVLLMRGGVAGYTPWGIADLHTVASTRAPTRSLGTTTQEAIIVQARDGAGTITPEQNLEVMARSSTRTTSSAVLIPSRADEPAVRGTARVTMKTGTTTVSTLFVRKPVER